MFECKYQEFEYAISIQGRGLQNLTENAVFARVFFALRFEFELSAVDAEAICSVALQRRFRQPKRKLLANKLLSGDKRLSIDITRQQRVDPRRIASSKLKIVRAQRREKNAAKEANQHVHSIAAVVHG